MSVNDPMMESKHHDPMLDGIQRYRLFSDDYGTNEYILLSDIPALIARVRADGQANAAEESGEASVLHFRDGYDAGYRDGRASMM